MMFSWMAKPISAGELWARLPVVDRPTRNLSLTRCIAVAMTVCWCFVVHANGFNWPSVAVSMVIAIVALAKSIDDLKKGFSAIGSALRHRRSTDSRPAFPDYEPTTRAHEGE